MTSDRNMTDVEQLTQRARAFLQEAVQTALESGDRDRRELAEELAAGRITPREAVVNLGYQELIESGLQPEPDPPAEQKSVTGPPPPDEDEDFSTRTVLRSWREA